MTLEIDTVFLTEQITVNFRIQFPGSIFSTPSGRVGYIRGGVVLDDLRYAANEQYIIKWHIGGFSQLRYRSVVCRAALLILEVDILSRFKEDRERH